MSNYPRKSEEGKINTDQLVLYLLDIFSRTQTHTQAIYTHIYIHIHTHIHDIYMHIYTHT